MTGQFSAHVMTSLISGFIISFPYVLFEFWKFISPGLLRNEKVKSKVFIFISSLLFFVGVLFGYYIVTPLSINFLATYQVSELVLNEIDLASYISLVRSSAVASGIIFELPIIIYFLSKIGLVTPEGLIKYRKFALVGVLILAALITPPDIASQIIVAIPIVILYQVSIFISKIVVKRNHNEIRS
jgi:sec-independent protein translocase protein TatC